MKYFKSINLSDENRQEIISGLIVGVFVFFGLVVFSYLLHLAFASTYGPITPEKIISFLIYSIAYSYLATAISIKKLHTKVEVWNFAFPFGLVLCIITAIVGLVVTAAFPALEQQATEVVMKTLIYCVVITLYLTLFTTNLTLRK